MGSLLIGISLVIVVTFLSYLATIARAFFRRLPDQPGDAEAFEWHMFVPCRDEDVVIGATIDRLRATFAGAHVWVIDDDSDDATADVVRSRAATDPMVHLVQRRRPHARTGKGDALNSAYHRLNAFLPAGCDRTRVIVCVVDADGQMAGDALDHVAGTKVFGDPRVGAAQISVQMRNRDDHRPRPSKGRAANALSRYLVRMQDIEFRTSICAMQALRTQTRSVGLGGNGQFTRLTVLDAIATQAGRPWHGALLEDFELGVHVLLTGHEIRFVADSYVSQEGLTDLKRLFTQRTRWSQGNIQCIKYLPQIVRSPHFTSGGVLESGYYLMLPFIQMLGLFLWPTLAVLTVSGTLQVPGGVVNWLASSWWLLALFFLMSVAPFAMWGPIYRATCEPRATRWQSILWGLGLWLYIYYMYVSVTRAFVRIALRRGGWAKTRRNGENLTVGATAKEA
ncbi:glycosyltransferase family 2 protein [Ruania alba]|uniref:Glycosyltransferase, catalytic subunit of cellulose synthase and poly-beta-1,6-N-acetylglucosamine synthase n=1 Tax=Ruania alba TaxID=648782 RepID=A0A1H5CEB6_9MICO|nr:glycosyltransferase family 2 protein [Ruania alba]SED64871.1 Glycosyltransferase, catalytic subunit of cellulose synthase and poly-beta-1,6-N-acetylglucosamine synthase [Ruania alba]